MVSPDKGNVRTVEPDDVTSHAPSDVAARPLYGPGGNYRPPLPWGGPPPGLGRREGEGRAGRRRARGSREGVGIRRGVGGSGQGGRVHGRTG